MSIHVEVTDTFNGEANYCWVKRHNIAVDKSKPLSEAAIVRRAKAWAGWNGLRCKREHYGFMIRITPHGMCQTMFITLG